MASDNLLQAALGALEGFGNVFIPYKQKQFDHQNQLDLLTQQQAIQNKGALDLYKQKQPLEEQSAIRMAQAKADMERADNYVPGSQVQDVLSGKPNPGTNYNKAVLPLIGNREKQNEHNLALSEKENQFWERQWQDFTNKNDPNLATSRTPIGMVGRANIQANRALTTLSKPTVTNQEAGNVMADLAGIYQGGAPTQFGMSHQEYQTLYGKAQSLLQQVSGKPQDALPADIKARLVSVLSEMKRDNQTILNKHFNTIEKTRKNLVQKYPDEWKSFRSGIEGDFGPEQGGGLRPPVVGQASPRPGGVLHQDADGNQAWMYPDGTFDEVK